MEKASIVEFRTSPYSSCISGDVVMTMRKGAEEAHNRLSELLEAAEKGRATIITKRGRPVAVLAPVAAYVAGVRQRSLLPVVGSGRGLWGADSARGLRKLRDQWSR
jgi:prevent-host-death family protein